MLVTPLRAWNGEVVITTPKTAMILHAEEGGDLRFDYYGTLGANLQQLRDAGADMNFSSLPAFGTVEATITQEPLTAGLQVIRNTDGARNAHCDAPELMLSLDGQPQENSGRTIGAALCWSGNYELRINTNNKKEHHFYAGIDPQASEYVLEPKEVFQTPHLALTFSTDGMGGVSRTFHRWARTCGMLHRGMNTGDILLNSWEGLYFDINEERMIQMMDDIAALGGELFKTDNYYNQQLPRIRLAGLDANKTYTLTERNVRVGQKPCDLSSKQFTGRFLMEVGIEVPLWEDYASRVFEIK